MTGDAAGATDITEARFVDAPSDANLTALYDYWNRVRGERSMPARADIDPSQIPKLLPYIVMYTVAPHGGGYTVRLIGGEVARFIGTNPTGKPAGSAMTPRGAATIVSVLDAVTRDRAPKFRAGKAHWHPDKTYRDFEACFLPLSADGETVNIIFSGVKFPR